MSRNTLAACLILLSGEAGAADRTLDLPALVIYNNTLVTLDIGIGPDSADFVTLQPGQETRSTFAVSPWIRFGSVRFEYVLPDHVVSFAGPATIYLQVESDGSLYFVPPLAGFSAAPRSDQPAGFPLKPTNSSDQL